MCFFNKKREILPTDVIKKINLDFNSQKDREIIKQKLEYIFEEKWNVGSKQLVRSILFLVNGDITVIDKYEFISDPRDIISQAEKESDGKYNYFNNKFK